MARERVFLSTILAAVVCLASSQNEGNIGTFWHVTDFHYDHTYLTDRLSCQSEAATTKLGEFGDYWCGAPWNLVTAAIDAMKKHDPNVDFIIWSGDTVAHIKDANLSVDINMVVLQNVTTALNDAFPDKIVYATFGNHDYWPNNQFPAGESEIYERTSEMWSHWINDSEQLDNFKKGGYYTVKTEYGLRILALNTNLYYTHDKVTKDMPDPADQLKWMRSVLQKAAKENEKVLLTAHIAPGVSTPTRVVWFYENFNQEFMSTLEEFTDVIVAMHYGHDHHDGFKIVYNKQGKPAVPLLLAPAVVPWRFKVPAINLVGPPHNPAVRLVKYDRTTGRHLDLYQYYLDLPRSSRAEVAEFTLLYRFTKHYDVTDLTAESLVKVVNRMGIRGEGDKLLNDYFRFTVAGANIDGIYSCDKTCKYRFLCGFREHKMKEFDSCVSKFASTSDKSDAPPVQNSAVVGLLALALSMSMAL